MQEPNSDIATPTQAPTLRPATPRAGAATKPDSAGKPNQDAQASPGESFSATLERATQANMATNPQAPGLAAISLPNADGISVPLTMADSNALPSLPAAGIATAITPAVAPGAAAALPADPKAELPQAGKTADPKIASSRKRAVTVPETPLSTTDQTTAALPYCAAVPIPPVTVKNAAALLPTHSPPAASDATLPTQAGPTTTEQPPTPGIEPTQAPTSPAHHTILGHPAASGGAAQPESPQPLSLPPTGIDPVSLPDKTFVMPTSKAATDASLPPPSSVGTTEQIAPVIVRLTAADGARQISLQLTPKDLGKVYIQIDQQSGGPVQVTLTAEHPHTLALLQRDHAQLTEALDRAGLPSENRSISFHLAASHPSGSGTDSNPTPDRGRADPPTTSMNGFANSSGNNGGSFSEARQQPLPYRSISDTGNDSDMMHWTLPDRAIAAPGLAAAGLNITA